MPFTDPEKRKEMNRIYRKRYMATEKGKAARRRGRLKYQERHPEKVAESLARRTARYYASEKGRANSERQRAKKSPAQLAAYVRVHEALIYGRLTREPCGVCGAERVHAHHPRGYLPPHDLDVEWLCTKHHRAVHMSMEDPA